MKKSLPLLALILSTLALIFSLLSFFKSRDPDKKFLQKTLHLTQECVKFSDSIEGKQEILKLIDRLGTKGAVIERGSDDLRVKYVLSQGCMEHVLACKQALGEIVDLIGVIHTPMPATPLCTLPENPDRSLLDHTIRHDLKKLLTVGSRAQIVREYLQKGGKLYIVYPQGGLEKRSKEQQAIYYSELARYPDKLIDWVLKSHQIDPEMVGATYFFKSPDKRTYLFSIKSRQANDPQELSEWGLWLGEIADPIVKERVDTLFSYFKEAGGPAKSCFLL